MKIETRQALEDSSLTEIKEECQILLKFANLDVALFPYCEVASFGLLSNDTWAQLHECQGLHNKVHTQQLCPAYRAEDRKWPMVTGHCQRTYVDTDIFLYIVMQCCWCFPAP